METKNAENILKDAEVKLTGYLSEKKYPESFSLIRFYDEEEDREFTFLTNTKICQHKKSQTFIRRDGWLNYFLNGSSNILR